ncbi:uncharacterized protein N7479_009998 [Penicillium vulpinum]|uniref:uncharacterized protein n=1 Tax=Penicillium vulpinum TaxID=29845 RepID=UPI002548E205|nr:uncharacterized protein N7479_009998 [Penicillium vulpinum]KAJ5951585.1 hypothetical protein N7479_009998 [Penicillium vulpinum]
MRSAFVNQLFVVPVTLAGYLGCYHARPEYFHGLSSSACVWNFILLHSILWAIFILEVYPRFICPLRSLPAPKGGYPLVGYGFSRFRKPVGSDHLQFIRDVPNNGLIRYRGFWNQNNVLLVSAEALAEVLVKRPYDFVKAEGPRDFERYIGKGFGFRSIKELHPLFWRKSAKLVQCMEADLFQNSEKGTEAITDINFWSTKVTLDMIGVAALGRDFNTLEKSDDILVQSYEEILDPTPGKLAMFILSSYQLTSLTRFIPGKVEKRFKLATATLREICMKFLQEKKSLMSNSQSISTDVLAKLIEMNEFADIELVDQLLTFIAAGHETTSSTFAWVIYHLARHPDIQSRLREELRTYVKPNDLENDTVDISSLLEGLPLLNGVINESLRLFPTVPLTMRTPAKPTTVLGYHIPMGTEIYIVPWSVNRSPETWGPTSEVFDPERWIDPTTKKAKQYRWGRQ